MFWRILLFFLQTGFLNHHYLDFPAKLELAYILHYFGLDLDKNANKFETVNELRHQLILYALRSQDEKIKDLVGFLVPCLHNELVGSFL